MSNQFILNFELLKHDIVRRKSRNPCCNIKYWISDVISAICNREIDLSEFDAAAA